MIIEKKDFDEQLKEFNHKFEGWNFSYLTSKGRMQEFPLEWNYMKEIDKKIKSAKSLLDMGTGGGEFLASLSMLPGNTYATEGYIPNIKIAKAYLEPLGVKVLQVFDDDQLPFKDEKFQLIINRHEAFSSKEVYRILKNKGLFITQQVGGMNDFEINVLLEAPLSPIDACWNLVSAKEDLIRNGFKIIKGKENFVKTRFYDIGAVVYYLKAIPWQVPDFSIDKYYNKLFQLHKIIEDKGYIDVTCHRFIIISEKK